MTNYHKELLDRPITTKNCLTDQLPQRIAWPTFHPFVCLHTHTRDFEFTADTDTAHYTSHTRWVRYLLGQIFAGSDIPTHAGSDNNIAIITRVASPAGQNHNTSCAPRAPSYESDPLLSLLYATTRTVLVLECCCDVNTVQRVNNYYFHICIYSGF